MKKRKIKTSRLVVLIGFIILTVSMCVYLIKMSFLFVGDVSLIQPEVKEEKIACIGDSITYGNGVWQTRESHAWSFLLENMLPKSYTIHNLGISGATLQAEGNNPYTASEQWQYAISHPHSIYIVMLGTNDTKPINWNEERYAKQLDDMIEILLHLEWKSKVIMMLPSRIFINPSTGETVNGMSNDVLVEKVHPIIRKVAKKHGLKMVDLYAITKDHPEYFEDGVHPGQIGNQKMAECIYEKLQ